MNWSADGWLDAAARIDSPNFGTRPEGSEVSLVVIHNISLPPGQYTGNWVEDFFRNRLDAQVHPYFASIADLQVSAHFYLRRDGRLLQFVSTDERAWHAGRSCWQGRENCNDYSVGIELEGCDEEGYTATQYTILFALIETLQARYPITAVAGHSHIAPERKSDPGPFFDWAAVRARFPELSLAAEVAA